MTTFYYRSQKTLEPRIGTNYATTYIKQDAQEYQRLLNWLVQIAENIMDIANHDPLVAEWFVRPMPDFRRSQRGQYYSPQDIITDMIDQMAHGRDLSEAMLNRWNRLTENTPWQIDMISSSGTTPQPQAPQALFA